MTCLPIAMNPLPIIPVVLLLSAVITRAQGSLPADEFNVLTREHTDGLCVLYDADRSPPLSLVAWQRDAGLDLPTNQVVLVVKEQARLTLPAGTPFGDAGAPFWILPQSQNANLLYLGVNVERVPSGVFSGPISIQLKRLEGPGYLMVWQATGPGQYNIRINTRDGIGPADSFQPLIGAHEHFNWGFSSTGAYCATFQAAGQRIGESTSVFSAESTFLFHVVPLPAATNFATWQKHFWPPGFNQPTTLAGGDPDGDGLENLLEYAFGASPTNTTPTTTLPCFSLVTNNGQRFATLAFTRYLPALDLDYTPEATSALPGGWERLTNIVRTGSADHGATELLSARDHEAATNLQRFLRLRVIPK